MSRKRMKREAAVDTPVDRLNKKETLEHYKTVQIENFQSKMDLVFEHTHSIEERLSARLDDIHEKLVARVEQLEEVVRRHSAQLEQIAGGGERMRRS